MSVIDAFCARHRLSDEERLALVKGLEQEFQMSVPVFTVRSAIRTLGAKPVLLIHDSDDEEFAIEQARAIDSAAAGSRLLVTNGNGHSRVVASRQVIREIREFLAA
jgi:fermentation-respiration switch protein FrsA (DUF1100 family)